MTPAQAATLRSGDIVEGRFSVVSAEGGAVCVAACDLRTGEPLHLNAERLRLAERALPRAGERVRVLSGYNARDTALVLAVDRGEAWIRFVEDSLNAHGHRLQPIRNLAFVFDNEGAPTAAEPDPATSAAGHAGEVARG